MDKRSRIKSGSVVLHHSSVLSTTERKAQAMTNTLPFLEGDQKVPKIPGWSNDQQKVVGDRTQPAKQ